MEATTLQTWHLVLEFTGLDLEDERVLDRLLDASPFPIQWSASEGVATARAAVAAADAPDAVALVEAIAAAGSNGVDLLRVVDPLVTVADIAEEAGVTRQAVRNWALGTRKSGFPRPVAVVGDGVRVWREAEVDAWLGAVMHLGSGHAYATPLIVAALNEEIAVREGSGGPSSFLHAAVS